MPLKTSTQGFSIRPLDHSRRATWQLFRAQLQRKTRPELQQGQQFFGKVLCLGIHDWGFPAPHGGYANSGWFVIWKIH